jgi:hypothetical protein
LKNNTRQHLKNNPKIKHLSEDHSSGYQWTGDLNPSDFPLDQAWNSGRFKAIEFLSKNNRFMDFELNIRDHEFKNVSMLNPFGLDQTINDDDDDEDDLEREFELLDDDEGLNDIDDDLNEVVGHSDRVDVDQIDCGVTGDLEIRNQSTNNDGDADLGQEGECLCPLNLNDIDNTLAVACDSNSAINRINYVKKDGREIHKANAINSVLNNQTKLSNDRLVRVRTINIQTENYNEECNYDSRLANGSNQIIISDYLATILTTNKGNIFIVVFCVQSITNHSNKTLTSITAEDICNSKFSGHLLLLSGEDESKNYVTWHREYGEVVKNINGAYCVQVDLIINENDQTRKSSLISIENLKKINTLLSALYFANTPSLPRTQLVLPKSLIPLLNIRVLSDKGKTANSGNSFECKMCTEKIMKAKMRCHIGKHILNNEIRESSVVCGFCGLTIGCNISIVATSGKGKNKTYGPQSNCKYFYKFSLAPAAVSKSSAPCSNRPIYCTNCPEKSVVIWSYNIKQHYKEFHPLCDLSKVETITDKEIESVLSS